MCGPKCLVRISNRYLHFSEIKNGNVLKNAISLRIRPSYSDDSFGYTLSQFLALSAHGSECHIEHVGELLISNSRIKRLLLTFIYCLSKYGNRLHNVYLTV